VRLHVDLRCSPAIEPCRKLRSEVVLVFEKGSASKAPEVDAGTVRDLHAKIGELAVANDPSSRRLKPWGGTW
jgi:hypothetical protein